MNRIRRTHLLITCALVASTGCAPAFLYRGPAVTTTVVAGSPDAKATKRATREARRAERDRLRTEQRAAQQAAKAATKAATKAVEQERKQKPARNARDEQHPAATSADAMGEARARATQNPSEPYWPYRIAQFEASAQRAEAAETSLKQALERDGSYAPALTELSRLYYRQGRHAEAIALLEPVRAHQVPLPATDRAAVLAGLAMHQAALDDLGSARATLAMLTRDERDRVPGVAAWLAVRDTSATAARNATEVAVRLAPQAAANHNNLGIALLRSGDPEAAAKSFEQAIALDPGMPGPYYNLAILERWYRLDRVAAASRFRDYWKRSHADPDSLYAELGHAPAAPIAEEGSPR